MQFRDYYATLGVSKTASEADIKKAFRKLARENHPDLNPGNAAAEARFKEINEAYEVLGDPATRKKYDELGANWKQYEQQAGAGGPGASGGAGWSPFGGGGGQTTYRTMTPEEMEELFGGQDPFSDFFHTFFSGGGAGAGSARRSQASGRRARRAEPAPQHDHPIDLTLEEVLQGAHRRLMVDTGQGSETVEVRIPAGVKDGARIRVAGKDTARGDIYLRVRVQPHAAFERRGDDLHTRFPVPVTTAVLGGEADVATMGGQRVRLRVPEGTRSGRVFRVRGQGLPAVGREARGDLYATADVQIPDRLTPEAREHYEALRALEAQEQEGTRTS